jgi:hypothetical protein
MLDGDETFVGKKTMCGDGEQFIDSGQEKGGR